MLQPIAFTDCRLNTDHASIRRSPHRQKHSSSTTTTDTGKERDTNNNANNGRGSPRRTTSLPCNRKRVTFDKQGPHPLPLSCLTVFIHPPLVLQLS